LDVPAAPDVVILPDGVDKESLEVDTLTLWGSAVILLPLTEAELPVLDEHPVLAALREYPLVTTVDYNWIRISTDGESLWVMGEH